MKPFIRIPEGKKRKTGRNCPRGQRRNRRWDGTTQRIREETEVTNETVHRKPGGKQETGWNCPGGNKNEAGLSGDEKKRWVGFRRRLSAGAILGRPACRVANSSAANQ